MPIRQSFRVLLIALIICTPAAAQKKKQLTIDDIFDPKLKVNFAGSNPTIEWLPNGREYLLDSDARSDEGPLLVIDAATGASKPLYDARLMEQAFAALAGFSADEAKTIAGSDSFTFNPAYTAVVVDAHDDLYYYKFGGDRAVRLTSDPMPETNASFSPDGRFVGFVRSSNLYIVDVWQGRERALTTNGNSDRLNGRLDWVYEEEVYGRGKTTAYWWSPDSTAIAYLSLDVSKVPEWTIPDEIPQHPRVQRIKYPIVGDPNPRAQLGIVKVDGGSTRWVDLAEYKTSDILIVRVGWTSDSKRLVYEIQNRLQSWLDLNEVSSDSGASRRLLREESQYWIDVAGLPTWLPDGSFLWQSDRTGYRHIYHYGSDGRLIKALTSGEWDIRELYGASSDGWIFVSAAEHSPIADHIYRVKTDGTEFVRLSQTEGHHAASFNAQMSLFVDTSSTATTPPQTRLVRADGVVARMIDENRIAAFDAYDLGKVEFVQVPTRDGFTMEAMMIKPLNFDSSKKYPVMSFTYAGPTAQSARNRWGGTTYMWRQMLAQRGYIVWVCDNRSASNKGIKSAYGSFHRFGEQELRDLEDGVAWLKQQPYVAGDRIGIQGWSFGGFMSAYALTHSSAFKLGIAGAPVTDWRNYDSIYTERYMGLPNENKKGYDDTSVIRAAGNLSGKLLLVHGAVDDNVHLQNSIQFADELQKAGKQFQLMVYPQERHTMRNPLRIKHFHATMTEFILTNL
jgi:dipeptidyl-peptidase 4